MSYPQSFREMEPSETMSHPEVFDPALKHYDRAFRHGEPRFSDVAARVLWLRTREQLWSILLKDIAGSRWREHLVLRGSMLLKHWFGADARDFADADWVVQPNTTSINSANAEALFADMTRLAKHGSLAEFPGIRVEAIAQDDIWTYDRVPGRRLAIYWRCDAIGSGCLQMDFVFGEEMWDEPIITPVRIGDAAPVDLWTASPALSLAWKLMWLDNDMHPQGKDLYDAVLLAESLILPRRLFNLALADRLRRSGAASINARVPLEWQIEWEDFLREYPTIPGTAVDYQSRLSLALETSFRHDQT